MEAKKAVPRDDQQNLSRSNGSIQGSRGDELLYLARFFTVEKAPTKKVRMVRWEKPGIGLFKLNTDASVTSARCSGGGVLRDGNGKVVFAFYKEFGESSVLEAETNAFFFLKLCKDRGYKNILVEVDSEALVRLVRSQETGIWPICYVLVHVRRCLEEI